MTTVSQRTIKDIKTLIRGNPAVLADAVYLQIDLSGVGEGVIHISIPQALRLTVHDVVTEHLQVLHICKQCQRY